MKTAIRQTRSGIEIRLGDWIHIFEKDGKYFDSACLSDMSPMDRAVESYKWRPKVLKKAVNQKGNENAKDRS